MQNLMKLSFLFSSVLFVSFSSSCSLSHLANLKDDREWTTNSPTINSSVVILDNLSDEELRAIDCTKPEIRHVTGAIDEIKEKESAIHNLLITNYYRQIESEYYPKNFKEGLNNKDWPIGLPKVGLAMSGGGIRSAAFNIGVLQGLEESKKDLLNEIDIISSVSGGSYANLWFTVNKLTSPTLNGYPPTNNLLLKQDGEYQVALEKKVEKFGDKIELFKKALAGPAAKTLLFLESSLISLFGMKGVIPYGSSVAYGMAIDETFMRTFNNEGKQATPTLIELSNFIKSKKLPFPIINTTSFEDESSESETPSGERKLFDTVFEITPIRIGSEGLGFNDRDIRLDLINVASASAAAIDRFSSSLYPAQKNLGMLLGVRVPYYVSAPRLLKRNMRQHRYTIQPSELRLHDIHLSDGGFSDNLGVYSLVKRLCKHIIVVDAGHDPSMAFEDYYLLKNRLKNEMQLNLKIKKIEEKSDQLWKEYRKESGDIEKEFMKAFSKEHPKAFYRADSMDENVFEGYIESIPFWENEQVQHLKIRITYIKLSLDKTFCQNGLYGNEVKQYYFKRKSDFNKMFPDYSCIDFGMFLSEDCIFPQDSTYNQKFSEEQFKAYKALGKAIINRSIF